MIIADLSAESVTSPPDADSRLYALSSEIERLAMLREPVNGLSIERFRPRVGRKA